MVSTNTKLAEAARRLDDAIKDLPDGCEGWLEPLDERIAELRAALATHDAEQAQEAQQPAGQEQDERAAFEAWAATYSTFPLERDDYPRLGTTSYTQMEQTMLWDAWQARAALAQRREPLTDEQISAAIDARLSLHMQNGIEEPFSLMVARAIEAAHGIGATTGKEPGNV